MHHKPGLSPHATGILLLFCGLIAFGVFDAASKYLLASFPEFGKLPRLVMRIAVEEAFLHCPKALMRARLWEPEAQVPRERLPSGAQMIFDQLQLGKPPISDEQIIESYKTQL